MNYAGSGSSLISGMLIIRVKYIEKYFLVEGLPVSELLQGYFIFTLFNITNNTQVLHNNNVVDILNAIFCYLCNGI